MDRFRESHRKRDVLGWLRDAGLFGVDVLAWLARIGLDSRHRHGRLWRDRRLHDRGVLATTNGCRPEADLATGFVARQEPRLEAANRNVQRQLLVARSRRVVAKLKPNTIRARDAVRIVDEPHVERVPDEGCSRLNGVLSELLRRLDGGGPRRKGLSLRDGKLRHLEDAENLIFGELGELQKLHVGQRELDVLDLAVLGQQQRESEAFRALVMDANASPQSLQVVLRLRSRRDSGADDVVGTRLVFEPVRFVDANRVGGVLLVRRSAKSRPSVDMLVRVFEPEVNDVFGSETDRVSAYRSKPVGVIVEPRDKSAIARDDLRQLRK